MTSVKWTWGINAGYYLYQSGTCPHLNEDQNSIKFKMKEIILSLQLNFDANQVS